MSCVFNSARSRIRLIWTAVVAPDKLRQLPGRDKIGYHALSLQQPCPRA